MGRNTNIMITNLRYEIEEDNTVKIWDTSVDPEDLVLIQPTWPHGQSWSSRQQAESWARLFVENSSTDNPRFLPGMSPENSVVANPHFVEES